MIIKCKNDWKELFNKEKSKEYFQELEAFILEERQQYEIYPEKERVFEAFNLCSYEHTKVVIIGQDPYHGPNQAHGLCFSVLPGNKIPPSLRNIYKELKDDLGCQIPKHGYLSDWAKQGVLMINSVFTVRRGEANTHKNMGWEILTKKVISYLNDKQSPVVFILWGNYAKQYEKLITDDQHKIIKSYHPSPLSASRGFFKSKPFSKSNTFLKANDLKPIDWCIDNI
ncbi:MAG TPA: uracil-DNA glycosylase [Clostridia bacterium]|nr:uracil-DNA glycosylase [Clostridia bacterium]